MTKICGVLTGDADGSPDVLLDRMCQASWNPSCIRREVWSDGRAALGHLNVGAFNLEPQPIHDPASKAAAVFCGQVFDWGDKRRALEAEGAGFRLPGNDGEFLLHWLRRRGTGALRDINGIFSLAVWDGDRSTLAIAGDRYGFRPLYYYHDVPRRALVFASDIRAVLATGLPPLRVNWRAVNTFLHLGHPVGDETLFQDIYRLPPASVLTFQDNHVRMESYWRLVDLPVREDMTIDQAVGGGIELFRQAIRRRAHRSPGGQVVLLSGGQDSRHITAEMSHQGEDFVAYTTWGPNVADKVLAAQAAAALGVRHVLVPLPRRDFFSRYWPRAHALVDYEVDLHEWILPLVDALPAEVKVVFDGILGDVCLCSVYLKPEDYALARQGRADVLARQLLDREQCPPVFDPSIERHLDRGLLYDILKGQFDAFVGHPNLISFTMMTARTRRAITLFAFKLISEKAEGVYPYADNDFFDFAMSIPPELKLDKRMHRRILDRAYPELEKVPTTKEIARRDYARDEINWHGQRRQQIRRGLWRMAAGRTWPFSRRTALPRLLRDLAVSHCRRDGRFFLCSPAIVVLAEWFQRYFPDGVE